jgi:hypothetical protein
VNDRERQLLRASRETAIDLKEFELQGKTQASNTPAPTEEFALGGLKKPFGCYVIVDPH